MLCKIDNHTDTHTHKSRPADRQAGKQMGSESQTTTFNKANRQADKRAVRQAKQVGGTCPLDGHAELDPNERLEQDNRIEQPGVGPKAVHPVIDILVPECCKQNRNTKAKFRDLLLLGTTKTTTKTYWNYHSLQQGAPMRAMRTRRAGFR